MDASIILEDEIDMSKNTRRFSMKPISREKKIRTSINTPASKFSMTRKDDVTSNTDSSISRLNTLGVA